MKFLDIDTLFLSGGGVNSIGVLGSLKYLFNEGLLDPQLKDIKNIIGVSGGLVHILPIILGYSIDETIDLFLRIDISKYCDNKLKLNNILTNYGINNNTIIQDISELFLKHKQIDIKITLREFYKLTNKNILFKSINLTKEEVVFINHKNYPELPLTLALCMTSCAPIIFTPVIYKNQLYIDGGVCGNFPFDIIKKRKFKKYIGINIIENNIQKSNINNKVDSFFEYLLLIYNIYGYQLRKEDNTKRIINVYMKGSGLNFEERSKVKNDILDEGYNQTKKFYSNIIDGL